MTSEKIDIVQLNLTIEQATKLCAACGHNIRLTEASIAGAKQDGYHPENSLLEPYFEKLFLDIYLTLKKHTRQDISKWKIDAANAE